MYFTRGLSTWGFAFLETGLPREKPWGSVSLTACCVWVSARAWRREASSYCRTGTSDYGAPYCATQSVVLCRTKEKRAGGHNVTNSSFLGCEATSPGRVTRGGGGVCLKTFSIFFLWLHAMVHAAPVHV